MKYNQFQILEKYNSSKLSIKDIIFFFLAISTLITILGGFFGREGTLDLVGLFVFFFGFCLVVFFNFFRMKSTQNLKGELSGQIEFNADHIRINNKVFPISQIESLKLNATDYIGKRDSSLFEFNLTDSTGTHNWCSLHLKDGQKIKTYFQIQNKDDFSKLENELIQYYHAGKIPWLELIKALQLETYQEVQEFKKSHQLKIGNKK